jgi:hypothetical protein
MYRYDHKFLPTFYINDYKYSKYTYIKLQPAPQVAIDYYRDGKCTYVYTHTHVSIYTRS